MKTIDTLEAYIIGYRRGQWDRLHEEKEKLPTEIVEAIERGYADGRMKVKENDND